mmetsp:Transcript_59545/g.96347  ORF Transcript_59545/g.96347 Transcript_59545/m.96347 type:complete len:316 (-) Transcript_59545:740-1687(-)
MGVSAALLCITLSTDAAIALSSAFSSAFSSSIILISSSTVLCVDRLSISWAISCVVCTISACISFLSCNSTLEFSITLGCPRLGCTLPPSSSACSSLDCILSVCSGDAFFVYWRGISPVYSGGICTLFVLHVNFPCLRTDAGEVACRASSCATSTALASRQMPCASSMRTTINPVSTPNTRNLRLSPRTALSTSAATESMNALCRPPTSSNFISSTNDRFTASFATGRPSNISGIRVRRCACASRIPSVRASTFSIIFSAACVLVKRSKISFLWSPPLATGMVRLVLGRRVPCVSPKACICNRDISRACAHADRL